MDITSETPQQTEHRLRRVLAASRLESRSGAWWYEEFGAPEFAARARPEALALVQNGRGWSQLVPVPDGALAPEPLAVWSFEFPPGLPNSGFVGWLASRIKERTGAGVVVVCGYDAARGGVYDHWGCPFPAAADVLAFIDSLRHGATSTRGPADRVDLDDCLMNAVSTAATGVIDERTLFHFRQQGAAVSACYRGGEIVDGHLCGTLDGRHLSFRYVQAQVDGRLDGGTSSCAVEQLDDGRWQIRERFEWGTREGGGENLIRELPPSSDAPDD